MSRHQKLRQTANDQPVFDNHVLKVGMELSDDNGRIISRDHVIPQGEHVAQLQQHASHVTHIEYHTRRNVQTGIPAPGNPCRDQW